jgi:NhaP-type Na+/H+ or K+/H+ antiporter
MKIDLLQVLYTVMMVIMAFLGAIVVTKTLSKWLKLDEKANKDTEENSKE